MQYKENNTDAVYFDKKYGNVKGYIWFKRYLVTMMR